MNILLRIALSAGGILTLTACHPTAEQPDTDLIDDALPAALSVHAAGCSPSDDIGSGSMIDTDLAVTAAHVVAGSTDVRVTGADGVQQSANVVLFDPALDLAVLRTAQPIGTPLDLDAPAETDDRAVIVTFRGDGDERGMITSRVNVVRTVNIDTTDIYLEGEVTRPGFEVDADIEPGDSGAVVVLPGGLAGGMIWSKSTRLDDRAWAIDLPRELGDADFRATLTDRVETGACTR